MSLEGTPEKLEPLAWALLVIGLFVGLASLAQRNWLLVVAMALLVIGQATVIWRARTGRT